jgi:hypothetical protein
VKSPNPIRDLKEKIIRGDKGDGIPNILSPDDSVFAKIRQKNIQQKNLAIWLDSDPATVFTE